LRHGTSAQWYKIDLGSAQTFDRFIVRWEWAYAKHYWVAWSDNDVNWYGYERWLNSRADDVIDFGNQTHRYIGVYMVERAPRMNNYSLWEFEAYDRPGVAASETESAPPQQIPEQ
jgi:hypothetical protein